MALFIPAGGEPIAITPGDGPAFSLPELQRLVGGYIEAIAAPDNRIMFLNEDGKREGLAVNRFASALAWASGLPAFDYIVGDVVVCTRIEAGEDRE